METNLIYDILVTFCVTAASWHSYAEACMCQRKMFGAKHVYYDKPYLVYLLRSPQSDKKYRTWTCGGTIISPSQVLTSAACLLDVSNVYVIAGLERYTHERDIATNECVKTHKRKVMRFCYPTAYNFSYSSPAQWAKLDIAVATVDKSYNFTDRSYRLTCSYIPGAVRINYDSFYQEPGTLVHAYGWGHRLKLRKPGDLWETMKYLYVADMEIMNKTACKTQFKDIDGMGQLIDKYMICANGTIQTTPDGLSIDSRFDASQLLSCRRSLRDGLLHLEFINDEFKSDYDFRSKAVAENATDELIQQNKSSISPLQNNVMETRRSGICENDHGGPLMTWIGSEEVIIGVAVTSLYNNESECVEPSLFMNTYSIKEILECLITNDIQERLRCAALLRSKGYEISQLDVHWVKDSDDLKEEKKIKLKQQIDLIKNVYPHAYLYRKTTKKIKTDKLKENEKLTEFVAKMPKWPDNSDGKQNKKL